MWDVDATLVVAPLLAGALDEPPQAPSAKTAQKMRLNRTDVLPIPEYFVSRLLELERVVPQPVDLLNVVFGLVRHGPRSMHRVRSECQRIWF